MIDLERMAPSELFGLYANVLNELRRRGIVRSANNPVADHAESLVVKALTLDRAPESTTGYDAADSKGTKYEIKARRFTAHNKPAHFSAIRGLDKHHFTYLVGVLFGEDFSVLRAALFPVELVEEEARYRKRINGWLLSVRKDLWARPEVKDITKAIRDVAEHGLSKFGPG